MAKEALAKTLERKLTEHGGYSDCEHALLDIGVVPDGDGEFSIVGLESFGPENVIKFKDLILRHIALLLALDGLIGFDNLEDQLYKIAEKINEFLLTENVEEEPSLSEANLEGAEIATVKLVEPDEEPNITQFRKIPERPERKKITPSEIYTGVTEELLTAAREVETEFGREEEAIAFGSLSDIIETNTYFNTLRIDTPIRKNTSGLQAAIKWMEDIKGMNGDEELLKTWLRNLAQVRHMLACYAEKDKASGYYKLFDIDPAKGIKMDQDEFMVQIESKIVELREVANPKYLNDFYNEGYKGELFLQYVNAGSAYRFINSLSANKDSLLSFVNEAYLALSNVEQRLNDAELFKKEKLSNDKEKIIRDKLLELQEVENLNIWCEEIIDLEQTELAKCDVRSYIIGYGANKMSIGSILELSDTFFDLVDNIVEGKQGGERELYQSAMQMVQKAPREYCLWDLFAQELLSIDINYHFRKYLMSMFYDDFIYGRNFPSRQKEKEFERVFDRGRQLLSIEKFEERLIHLHHKMQTAVAKKMAALFWGPAGIDTNGQPIEPMKYLYFFDSGELVPEPVIAGLEKSYKKTKSDS